MSNIVSNQQIRGVGFYDKMPKVTKCPSMTKCPKSICPNDILPNHDKMPKLIKCPKDILPKMTICPKSHFAQGDKLPKLSLWQSAIFVTYSPKFSNKKWALFIYL